MPRGTQFQALQVMLRDELGRSDSPAVGVSDLPRLSNAINRVYIELAEMHDWPHLRKTFSKITLNAGQSLYDFPSDLNYDRVEQARVWWTNTPKKIHKGISLDDYVAFDTTAGIRADPVQKWDIRWTGTKEQIEVWPLPAGTSQLQFIGFIKTPKLINPIDTCMIDDNLVTLFAAIRFIKDPKEKQLAQSEAQEKLMTMKANTEAGGESIRLGLGEPELTPFQNVVIRVK